MAVVAPVKKDLSTWQRSPYGSLPQEVWEISAPQENSLYWSLMCSYLIKSSASGILTANIENITGTVPEMSKIIAEKNIEVRPDIKKIETRLKNINPFKNVHTLYYDDDLIALMQIFKLRLNQLANQLSKEKKTYDENVKIEAASIVFSCQIDLCEDKSGNRDLKTFIPKTSNANSIQLLTLIIFKYEWATSEKTIYKMGFEEDYSQNLWIKALKHFLKVTKLHSQQTQTILDSVPSDDKLLHHLLVSGSAKEAIPELYESSYILKKLSDAGYDVDPLSIGPDGFSAYYHCIRLNDWGLLFTLHNHVTKSDTFLEFREVLKQLRNVKRILQKDRINSQNFSLLSPKQKEAQLMFSQIHRIIAFQREVIEGIVSINPLYQVNEKQNRIIIFTLSIYNKYFYFDNRKSNNQYDQFLDYTQCYNYHKYIDDFTFLIFFDNFLSLTIPKSDSNETLVNNSLIYLLEYIISKNIFEKNRHIGAVNYLDKDGEKEHFVPFCFRMKFKNLLSTFCTVLECTSSNSNILTVDTLINCLKKHPILEEEFQISRFEEYLKIGGNVSFEESNTAAPFVIERTLQVIGETLSTISDGAIVTPLIKYSFTPNLAKILCDVRNYWLSHLRTGYAQGRKELERSDLLKKIQDELNKITESFEAIFMLQTLRVKEDMVEYGVRESRVYPDRIKNNLDTIKNEISMLKRNFYRRHTNMYINIAYKIITSLTTSLENFDSIKINELLRDYKSLKFLLTLISEYCNIDNSDTFHDVLGQIDLLIDEQNMTNKVDENKRDIHDAFLSLKLNFEGLFTDILNPHYEIDLSNLSALFDFIKTNDIFTVEEKRKIKKGLLEIFEKPEKAKQQLIDHANGQVILTNVQIKGLLNDIIANEKIKKDIEANPAKVLLLQNQINLGGLFLKEELFFIDFVCILSDDKFMAVIPNLCLPKNLHSKIGEFSNRKLPFLKDRMNLLEKILIEENAHISSLRKYGTSPECKDHVKRLIRLRYLEEKDTRAAVETLLLDCLEILNKRPGFEDLFTKTSNFLRGINLRNFLSHGCPIFETANDYLHPNNLPGELIEIILELIEDQKALEALIDIWIKTENPKISKLRNIILDQNNPSSSRNVILKWESYLHLLPINRGGRGRRATGRLPGGPPLYRPH